MFSCINQGYAQPYPENSWYSDYPTLFADYSLPNGVQSWQGQG